MVTYEDFFRLLLGVPSPQYTLESFFLDFIIPLAVIWYAFYLLIGRIYQRQQIVQIVLGLVFAFPTLRFGGTIALWIGLAGVLGLRARGITAKALGVAIVFLMYQYAREFTITNIPTIVALFGILYILLKPWTLTPKIFATAPVFLLWYALRDWQLSSITELFPAIFAAMAFGAWYQLIGWRRYVAIVGIVLAYFLFTNFFGARIF